MALLLLISAVLGGGLGDTSVTLAKKDSLLSAY